MKFMGILALSALFLSVDAATVEFSYDNQTAWPFLPGSSCGGMRQSPIDIVTDDVEESDDLQTLVFNSVWDDEVTGTLTNTLHTVKFSPDTSGATLVNHRGTYNFAQFHFHWGESNAAGSEHLVNSTRLSAEVHFVHTKEGGSKTDGDYYSVVGVLLEVTSDEATGIWGTLLNNIPTSNSNTVVSNVTLRVSDLLPDNRDYYYYMGSLTTPTCDETVQWFVLKDTITIPASVLAHFRTIEGNPDGDHLEISHNFRDEQDLNGRVVQTPAGESAGGSAAVTAASVVLISAFAAVASTFY